MAENVCQLYNKFGSKPAFLTPWRGEKKHWPRGGITPPVVSGRRCVRFFEKLLFFK
jgi:hypothetical protein